MARGWESKSVESQQADLSMSAPRRPVLSAEDLARRERAASIALALADTTAQLQAACRPVHRESLHQRVQALQALLAEVDAGEGTS